jgi:hypothetical protein
MNHDRLNIELPLILADQAKGKITSITKSDRNGATIEIVNKEPVSYETFIYKEKVNQMNENHRNIDFNELQTLILIQNEK